jgi:hypothetical protein
MVGRGLHREPRLFQGQPAKDRNRTPHSGDHIFTGASFDSPPTGPPEQTPHQGDEWTHSEHCACNPRHDGCDDQERHSLSPEGPGPKTFRSNMRDACYPKHFWAPKNIIKYDGKTIPMVWLEDHHLVCRAGGVDDDLFTIQFLPIFLTDTARAWLDHLPRNTIDY